MRGMYWKKFYIYYMFFNTDKSLLEKLNTKQVSACYRAWGRCAALARAIGRDSELLVWVLVDRRPEAVEAFGDKRHALRRATCLHTASDSSPDAQRHAYACRRSSLASKPKEREACLWPLCFIGAGADAAPEGFVVSHKPLTVYHRIATQKRP